MDSLKKLEKDILSISKLVEDFESKANKEQAKLAKVFSFYLLRKII